MPFPFERSVFLKVESEEMFVELFPVPIGIF
jgi:hypothetical protein